MIVAGVDGCKAGWVAALWRGPATNVSWTVCRAFDEVLDAAGPARIIAVDTPIGLLDTAERGGRVVDRAARRMLGPLRGMSVFSAPVRGVLSAGSYAEARQISERSSPHRISLSAQCFNICHSIRHVDAWITPLRQERVIEVHPELCFFTANDDAPVTAPKRTREGATTRRRLLAKVGVQWEEAAMTAIKKRDAAPDDLLDAAVAAWAAWRHAGGEALCVPDDPPTDARGLRMEMWR